MGTCSKCSILEGDLLIFKGLLKDKEKEIGELRKNLPERTLEVCLPEHSVKVVELMGLHCSECGKEAHPTLDLIVGDRFGKEMVFCCKTCKDYFLLSNLYAPEPRKGKKR